MNMFVNRAGRGRIMATALASAALAATGGLVTISPAQSTPSTGDCKAAEPVASVTKGDAVTGKTVDGIDSGTVPADFHGTVLGVVKDGIAPGIDMVMADLASDTSTAIQDKGIWQGMSGSPVYAADGNLIGAVAYSLSWGATTVAGITPFENMQEYMAATNAPVRVAISDAQARTIAQHTDVTQAQASEGFHQLAMPTSFNGLSAARLDKIKSSTGKWTNGARFFQHAVSASGSSASAVATADDIVAGGNLAASISYGDITAAGVGTATSVCNGRVVGFGHPMTFGGRTTLGLAPADALYVQRDPLGSSFKMANVGEPVGTITDDHLTGITGTFGLIPASAPIESTVTYGTRHRTGTSNSLLSTNDADILFSQVLANHDRVVDAIMPGSESLTYSVTGTGATGAPFTIDYADLYQSDRDISFDSVWGIADATYVLSQMKGVTIDGITVGSTVSDDANTLRIQSVEQRIGGHWVALSRRSPAVASRGETLTLRAKLLSTDGSTTTVPLSAKVPNSSKIRFAVLEVEGGASSWNRGVWNAETPKQLDNALNDGAHNNELQTTLAVYGRHVHGRTSTISAPQSHVVYGGKQIEVVITR